MQDKRQAHTSHPRMRLFSCLRRRFVSPLEHSDAPAMCIVSGVMR